MSQNKVIELWSAVCALYYYTVGKTFDFVQFKEILSKCEANKKQSVEIAYLYL